MIAMATIKCNSVQLAALSGVSRATISYVKNGKSCKPDVVGKLAEALGIPVEELLETKNE